MRKSEGIELSNDIDEALIDLGAEDNLPNIVWKKRMRSIPDLTYLREKDNNPVYTDYIMTCLPMGQLTAEEITREGLNDAKVFKFYISGKQFVNYSNDTFTLVPENADRLTHRGIVFEVVKRRPIQIGENDVLYVIHATEAAIIAQTELYRETQDPYFEYDASQEIISTDDTGLNTNLFVDLPIIIDTEVDFPFILWDIMTNFRYKTETMTESSLYTIPAGTYSKESFIATFTPPGLTITATETGLRFTTLGIGENALLEILITDDHIYDMIGISVGLYKGSVEMKI